MLHSFVKVIYSVFIWSGQLHFFWINSKRSQAELLSEVIYGIKGIDTNMERDAPIAGKDSSIGDELKRKEVGYQIANPTICAIMKRPEATLHGPANLPFDQMLETDHPDCIEVIGFALDRHIGENINRVRAIHKSSHMDMLSATIGDNNLPGPAAGGGNKFRLVSEPKPRSPWCAVIISRLVEQLRFGFPFAARNVPESVSTRDHEHHGNGNQAEHQGSFHFHVS